MKPDYIELTYKADHVIKGAEFAVIGDSPSMKDIDHGRCFTGEGAIAFSKTCGRMGLDLSKANLHTVLDFWPPSGEAMSVICDKKTRATAMGLIPYGDAWVDQKTLDSFNRIKRVIEETRPKKILLLGGMALYALFKQLSISAWRGSVLDYVLEDGTVIPCVPTYHPSAVMRKKEWHIPQMRDIQRFIEGKFTMPNYDIKIGLTFSQYVEELKKLKAHLDKGKAKLAIDIETRTEYITVLGFAKSKTEALVIPFIKWDNPNYFTIQEEQELVPHIRAVLNHENLIPVGQNFQYDLQYLIKFYGMKLGPWKDTMVDAHLLWTKGLELGLSFLASMYCEWYRYWKDDGKDFHKEWKSKETQDTYWLYNGYDCCYTFEVSDALDELWASDEVDSKLLGPYHFQHVMQVNALKPVLEGIRFDRKLQREFLAEMLEVKKAYEAWFEYMIPNEMMEKGGKSPWWDSPTKLAHFLYVQLGITPIRDKKTKSPTTGGDAPKRIGEMEPLLKLVMTKLDEYRSINIFINMFLSAQPSPEDGRMRTQYMVPGTDTFRLASKGDAFGYGMNLQNISKG